MCRSYPQGSILGPLLFNIFINDLPLCFKSQETNCDMFADDASIHSADKDMAVLSARLQKSLEKVEKWCQQNSMVLHPTKTKAMVIATHRKQQNGQPILNLSLQGKPVEEVSEHKLLGVIIDNELSWKAHTTALCKRLSGKLYTLSKLKLFLDYDSRKMFVNAHIRCHIDYASTVWDGCGAGQLSALNSLHRRAAKLILPDPDISTDQKLQHIGMLPLKTHLLYNKCIFMYKFWNNRLPKYLSPFFQRSGSWYGLTHKLFLLPLPRIEMFKSSLSFSGSSAWNQLSITLKSYHTLSKFKSALMKSLLED